MAFAFKQSSGVADQVRAIAVEQIDKALQAVQANGDFDKTVHTLRKACKKLRALLKLVRPVFEDYEPENAAIKAIADQFSVARDAAVMVETLAGLSHPAAGPVLDRLSERARHLRSQMGEEALLASARAQLEDLRQSALEWRFGASGRAIVLPGLRKSYARFRKGFAVARDNGDSETIHDWRKAAKTHWYHTRLFEPAAPDVLGGAVVNLEKLGTMLGDHQNLAVLASWIDTNIPPGDDALESLCAAIAARELELASASLALGRQFVVEKPSALAQRFEQYWQLLD
jgi:CHAD domain-containing protein